MAKHTPALKNKVTSSKVKRQRARQRIKTQRKRRAIAVFRNFNVCNKKAEFQWLLKRQNDITGMTDNVEISNDLLDLSPLLFVERNGSRSRAAVFPRETKEIYGSPHSQVVPEGDVIIGTTYVTSDPMLMFMINYLSALRINRLSRNNALNHVKYMDLDVIPVHLARFPRHGESAGIIAHIDDMPRLCYEEEMQRENKPILVFDSGRDYGMFAKLLKLPSLEFLYFLIQSVKDCAHEQFPWITKSMLKNSTLLDKKYYPMFYEDIPRAIAPRYLPKGLYVDAIKTVLSGRIVSRSRPPAYL
jgi:hypothetical protein